MILQRALGAQCRRTDLLSQPPVGHGGAERERRAVDVPHEGSPGRARRAPARPHRRVPDRDRQHGRPRPALTDRRAEGAFEFSPPRRPRPVPASPAWRRWGGLRCRRKSGGGTEREAPMHIGALARRRGAAARGTSQPPQRRARCPAWCRFWGVSHACDRPPSERCGSMDSSRAGAGRRS